MSSANQVMVKAGGQHDHRLSRAAAIPLLSDAEWAVLSRAADCNAGAIAAALDAVVLARLRARKNRVRETALFAKAGCQQ